jgi:hypothetical protein
MADTADLEVESLRVQRADSIEKMLRGAVLVGVVEEERFRGFLTRIGVGNFSERIVQDGHRLRGIELAVDPGDDEFAHADEQVGGRGNEKLVVALVINADDLGPVGKPRHDLVNEVVPVMEMEDVRLYFFYNGNQAEEAEFIEPKNFIIDAVGPPVFVKPDMGTALQLAAISGPGPAREIVLVILRVAHPGPDDVGEAAAPFPVAGKIDLQDFLHERNERGILPIFPGRSSSIVRSAVGSSELTG